MDYTKKIMYQSNSWYNDGLRKAQVRDMSGAIVSLQQSLQYNMGEYCGAESFRSCVLWHRGSFRSSCGVDHQ